MSEKQVNVDFNEALKRIANTPKDSILNTEIFLVKKDAKKRKDKPKPTKNS